MAAPSAAAAPAGGAAAWTNGVFGAPVPWPIIAIHVVLLPDGRVMNYGTDEQGQQGAQLVYDVWNPTLGTGVAAHTVLPNTTSMDIFCSGQSVIAASGEVIMTGGAVTIGGQRNFSNHQTTIFNPQTNEISAAEPMLYARWYPTTVALAAARFWSSAAVRTRVQPSPFRPPKSITRVRVGGRCGAPRAMRLSGQSPGIIRAPFRRPAAQSSCSETTARRSI